MRLHAPILVLALATSAACAGTPAPAVQPEPEGVLLAAGQPVNGQLTADDPFWGDHGRFDLYRFSAEPGERVAIVLRSDDFDTYLVVGQRVGGVFDALGADDDGGGDTDSRVRFIAPASGTFLVLAQAYSEEGLGAYSIELSPLPPLRPVDPAPIVAGQPVSAVLDERDPLLEGDDSHYDLYTFGGTAGERYVVTMKSEDFDTYLHLGRWDGSELTTLANDDDGADGTDSRLVIVLPETGEYGIYANAYDAGGAGAYTLLLERLPAPGPVEVVAIEPGAERSGSLEVSDPMMDDGSFYDVYSFRARAGTTYRITLRSSDFDAFLTVGTGAGDESMDIVETDDDGADGTDSRLLVRPDADTTYYIRANSLGGGETGAYVLAVERM